MGIFNRNKKDQAATDEPKKVQQSTAPKADKPAPVKQDKEEKSEKVKEKKQLKGSSLQAHSVIIKPMITEKASHIAAQHKYVFMVDSSMNKIEIKKAIRSLYHVEPLDVNVANFSGKRVRYGRVSGVKKSWKKAIVTLKPEDTIEVYEGV